MILHLHHVPGRLRVRLAKLRHNQQAAAPLRAELLAIHGVKSVSVNPNTGSIIVHYCRDEFEPEIFWSTLRRLGYIDDARRWAPRANSDQLRSVASEAAHTLVKALLSVFLERWLAHSTGMLIKLIT